MKSTLERLFLWFTNNPKSTIGLVLVFVSLLITGIPNLTISNDFRVYLGKDNPQLKAFEVFENNYIKSDTATFVIGAKQGDLFTEEGLTLIRMLTERSWFIDHSYRVNSLSNYIYTSSNDDEIQSQYLYEATTELTPVKLEQIRRQALTENRLVKSLITADGKLTVIVIYLNLPESETNASVKVTQQVESIRDELRNLFPQFQIDNGGSTAFNTTLARAVANDLLTLLPISYLIIFAGLFLFLRSVAATACIFILITVCLLATFGFFGWVAPLLTPIAGFAPSILLSIMVADSVHLLVTYQLLLSQGDKKQAAILESLRVNFMPILITSLTTMIGFLSLNFSASPPYQDLGNMVAFGVFLALVFSLVLLPALMMLFPEGRRVTLPGHKMFGYLAQLVIEKKKQFFLAMSLIIISLVLFIPNNRVSDNWANYFDDSFDIVKLVQQIDGYLTGVNALEYSIASNEAGGIFDPDYLQQLDEFEAWFQNEPKTVSISSFSTLMKDLNQVMHNDDLKWHRTPESSELAAQYLLFYEFGLPEGLGLNNLVTIHKNATRFTVSISYAGSDELLEIDRRAQLWLKQNTTALNVDEATGLGMVFAHIAQRNISSLLLGTLIALIGISVVLMVVLKSVKYGLISLVPNLVPAAMAYGLWGLTYGYVDIALSIVACSTLGIVVDDTVHFLHKYIRARRQGLDAKQSVEQAFSRVGLALLTTTMVLAGGFVILALSPMNTSATIGILMAITLCFALIIDFLLLPPLLLYLDRDKETVVAEGERAMQISPP